MRAQARCRSATASLVSLLLWGCQPELSTFSDRQQQMAQRAAARVRPEEVIHYVQEIYDARLASDGDDVPFAEKCPRGGCVYSRARVASLVQEIWSALPAPLRLVAQHVEDQELPTTNLFVDIPSAEPSEEWVLAVAHYDAWFGGANDNATGVAVTLEAAFALAGLALERNVRLLLTDGEEMGIVGTERYIDEFGIEGVVIVLNADMVAHRGDDGNLLTREPAGTEYIVQANDAAREAAFRFAHLARHLPDPIEMRPVVFPDDGVSVTGFAVGSVLSDHGPFWLRGVSALFPFPAGDKPDWYHTAEDTPDMVDHDRLRRFARLWSAALAGFATQRAR